MIKCILFDLDGVLVDCKNLHYEALNKALEHYKYSPISYTEHVTIYDGLSTSQKLDKLLSLDRINLGGRSQIANMKQILTEQYIEAFVMPDKILASLFRLLKEHYRVMVCSNARRSTCIKLLGRLGLYKLEDNQSLLKMSDIISNDDMTAKKPSAHAYISCLTTEFEPNECLVIEDSYHGTSAAKKAGMHVLNVRNSTELSYGLIQDEIRAINKRSVSYSPNFRYLNVLIPMSGNGQRFKDAGYDLPKPLIDVNGKPMITRVIENLNLPNAHYSFIVQREHEDKYNISGLLKSIVDSPNIVLVDKVTEGAACSALLAKSIINTVDNLIIANSDQLVEWNSFEFLYQSFYKDLDANIAVFEETLADPKWSYSEVNSSTGLVTRVAEKQPISGWANTGITFWKRGRDFVESAEQMIKENNRINNEFFILPSINKLIANRKRVGTYKVSKMMGIGTPNDLLAYLESI